MYLIESIGGQKNQQKGILPPPLSNFFPVSIRSSAFPVIESKLSAGFKLSNIFVY